MCGGGGDQTVANTNQNTTYKAAGSPYFKDVIGKAQAAAGLPYKPITQQVAKLTPQQLQAMQNVSNAYSLTSPYIQSAASHFENSAQALDPEDIERYFNPYSDAVMANLNEVFGQQQRDTTGKLTGAAGGVGADRVAVGQAELGRQQGLAAGQTMAGIYQNALQAAQNQQGIEQASAYGLGNLSQAEMNNILAASQSLFGMGTHAQQTNQAKFNADFNQKMAAAGYPFQTAQWYANTVSPAATGLGGTTRGTGRQVTDPPDPNIWSQVLGAGVAALGVMSDPALKEDKRRVGALDDGTPIYSFRYKGQPQTQIGLMADDVEETHPEAVSGEAPFRMVNYDLATKPKGYAMGGAPYGGGMPYAGGGGYIPQTQAPQIQQHIPQLMPMQPMSGGVAGMGSNVDYGAYAKAGQGANSLYNDIFSVGSPETNMGWSTHVSPSGSAGWGNFLSNMFQRGGRTKSESFKVLEKIARGGQVDREEGGGVGLPLKNPMMGRKVLDPMLNGWGLSTGYKERNATDEEKFDIQRHQGKWYGPDEDWNREHKAKGGEVAKRASGGSNIFPGGLWEQELLTNKFSSPYALDNKSITDFLPRVGDNAGVPAPVGSSSPFNKPMQYPDSRETIMRKMPPPRTESTHAKMMDKFISDPGEKVGPPATAGGFSPPGFGTTTMMESPFDTGEKEYRTYDAEGGYSNEGGDDYWNAGGTKLKPTFDQQAAADKWEDVDASGAAAADARHGDAPVSQGDTTTFDTTPVPTGGDEGSPTVGMDGGSPFKGSGSWSDRVAAAYGDGFYSPVKGWSGKPISNARLALMAAGLGMMGGESPHFGVNVGQGGLKGIQALQEFQKLDAARQAQAFNNMLEAGRLDVSQGQLDLAEWDKPHRILDQIDNYELRGGDPEIANQRRQRVYDMFPHVLGESARGRHQERGGQDPIATGEVTEAKLPETEYGAVEPPALPYVFKDRYERAQAKELSVDGLKKAKEHYDSAQTIGMQLAQMRLAFKELPTDGLLAPGSFNQFRGNVAKMVQTAYGMLGVEPPFDIHAVDSIQELNKLTTRMGFDLARTLGTREAMQVIAQAVNAVPGSDNTPGGARRIMAGIQAGILRDSDYYEFLSKWSKKNKGDISGAAVEFNRVRPISHYVKMSQEIAAAQELVANGDMTEAQATEHLIKMGIDPAQVF